MSDHEPFSPINLAQDHYSSPATGLSTEKGDSWLTVQQKINAGFKHVYALFGSIGIEAKEAIEAIDHDARKEINDLREEVTALQMKLEALMTPGTPIVPIGGDPQVEAKIEGAPASGTTEGADGFKAPGAGSE